MVRLEVHKIHLVAPEDGQLVVWPDDSVEEGEHDEEELEDFETDYESKVSLLFNHRQVKAYTLQYLLVFTTSHGSTSITCVLSYLVDDKIERHRS